jgi:tetratricopeptide (TPR) repeat protein
LEILRRATVAVLLTLALAPFSVLAELPTLSLRVTDPSGQPVAGLGLKLGESSPGVTNEFGEVTLDLGPKLKPGVRATLLLGAQNGAGPERWFLLSPWEGEEFQIPGPGPDPFPVKVARLGAKDVLANDAVLKSIAEMGADRIQELLRPGESYEALRRRVIEDLADQAGLKASEVEQALRAWGERTPDPLDEGVAALASGQYAEAEVKLEQAQREQKENLVRSSRLLGQARYAQGKYREAVGAYQVAVAMEPKDLGLSNALGLAHLSAGNYLEARRIFAQGLGVLEDSLGSEHPDTLTSMNSLALTLDFQGELGPARVLQEQVLEVRKRILGSEHPDTLTSMNNLARTLSTQGELVEARVLQEQVLEARKRVLGSEHPDTLTSMNNLAETLRFQGELGPARVLQEQVLEVMNRVLGADHPDTLTSMSNLAGMLRSEGELGPARVLQEQVLKVMRRVLGAEHPATLTSMNNLAETLRFQGELGPARVLHEQVLEVRERVLGAEHLDTASSEWNLLLTVFQQGDGTASVELIQSLSRLLDEDPAQLSAKGREIREGLTQLLQYLREAANSSATNAPKTSPP